MRSCWSAQAPPRNDPHMPRNNLLRGMTHPNPNHERHMTDFSNASEDFMAEGAEAHICATQANPVLYIERAIKAGIPSAVLAWSGDLAKTEERAAIIIARSPTAAKEFNSCHKTMAAYFRHEAKRHR